MDERDDERDDDDWWLGVNVGRDKRKSDYPEGESGGFTSSKVWASPLNKDGLPSLTRVSREVCDYPCAQCGKMDDWMLCWEIGVGAAAMILPLCNKCEGQMLKLHLHSYLRLTRRKSCPEIGFDGPIVF